METIKIQNPNDENDFLIINKRDFDPEKHIEWVDPSERKQSGEQNGGEGGDQNGSNAGGEAGSEGLPDVPQPAAATAPEMKEEEKEELPEVPEPKAASSSKKGRK